MGDEREDERACRQRPLDEASKVCGRFCLMLGQEAKSERLRTGRNQDPEQLEDRQGELKGRPRGEEGRWLSITGRVRRILVRSRQPQRLRQTGQRPYTPTGSLLVIVTARGRRLHFEEREEGREGPKSRRVAERTLRRSCDAGHVHAAS